MDHVRAGRRWLWAALLVAASFSAPAVQAQNCGGSAALAPLPGSLVNGTLNIVNATASTITVEASLNGLLPGAVPLITVPTSIGVQTVTGPPANPAGTSVLSSTVAGVVGGGALLRVNANSPLDGSSQVVAQGTLTCSPGPVGGQPGANNCVGLGVDCFTVLLPLSGPPQPLTPSQPVLQGRLERGLGPLPLPPPPPGAPPPLGPDNTLRTRGIGSFAVAGVILVPPGAVPSVRFMVVNSSGQPQGSRDVLCAPADPDGRSVCNTGVNEPGIFPQHGAPVQVRIVALPPPPPPLPPPPPPAPPAPPSAPAAPPAPSPSPPSTSTSRSRAATSEPPAPPAAAPAPTAEAPADEAPADMAPEAVPDEPAPEVE